MIPCIIVLLILLITQGNAFSIEKFLKIKLTIKLKILMKSINN